MENLIADIRQKGIGSMFSTADSAILNGAHHPSTFLPKNHHLFYSGRHAIKFVIETVAREREIPTIWIPRYYCQHVTHWMQGNYSNIKTYHANARDGNEVLRADDFVSDGDIVLINNYWGINKCLIETADKQITVIEDHSHGWLSPSCLQSNADYCITSLRKSIPAPLGGIAWRPDGSPMQNVPVESNVLFKQIWNKIKEAQSLKTSYQKAENPNESDKQKSLALMNEAEDQMSANFDLVSLDAAHQEVIKKCIEVDYVVYKKNNLSYLKSLLRPSNVYEVVTPDQTTFGLILYIADEQQMLKLRSYLVSQAIYPSLLWPNNPASYGYYLNIHVDFRYDRDEMMYIADKLNLYQETS
ncbi:hypothetical protein ACJD0Z_08015 [Flavobacteriaceae bacterium M23B6Z8]